MARPHNARLCDAAGVLTPPAALALPAFARTIFTRPRTGWYKARLMRYLLFIFGVAMLVEGVLLLASDVMHYLLLGSGCLLGGLFLLALGWRGR